VWLEARYLVDLPQLQVFVRQLVLDLRLGIRDFEGCLAVREEVADVAFLRDGRACMFVLFGLASDDCFEEEVPGLGVFEDERRAFFMDGPELLDAFLEDVCPVSEATTRSW